jgi:hypothetical protein
MMYLSEKQRRARNSATPPLAAPFQGPLSGEALAINVRPQGVRLPPITTLKSARYNITQTYHLKIIHVKITRKT